MSSYGGFRFRMSEQEMALAREPALARFTDPRLNGALVKAVMRGMANGDDRAFYVPVIHYGIEYAINSLRLPVVRARLPQEVTLRSLVAERIGDIAAHEGIQNDWFLPAYENNRHLRQGLNRSTRGKLSDPDFLGSFMSVPWAETSPVVAGAFGALEARGIAEGRATIVAQSRGLHIGALVPAEARKDYVKGYLGFPYADPDHFDVNMHSSGTTVVFNQETLDFIGQYIIGGCGCPAASVRLKGAEGSVLQQSFADMTYCLLEGDAVVTPNFETD